MLTSSSFFHSSVKYTRTIVAISWPCFLYSRTFSSSVPIAHQNLKRSDRDFQTQRNLEQTNTEESVFDDYIAQLDKDNCSCLNCE